MIQAPRQAKLLIVDDDPSVLRQLDWGLRDTFEISTAATADAALHMAANEKHDVVALDLALANNDPQSGLGVLERLLSIDPSLKVVLVTGQSDRRWGVEAIERGAFDYFEKPVDIDELRVLLGRALVIRELEEKPASAKTSPQSRETGSLSGQSRIIQKVKNLVDQASRSVAPVLLRGPSGSGKALVAQEIHRLSGAQRFAMVNCRSVPAAVLEKELLGSEGAITDPNPGTVFLEDVDSLSPVLQDRLMQALLLGRSAQSPRLISAATVDVAERVEQGSFREDLYLRLAVISISVPGLEERREDIVAIAEDFLTRFKEQYQRPELQLTRQGRTALQRYAWPGNVRELEHRMQEAVVLTSGKRIGAEELHLQENAVPEQTLRVAREEAEKRVIQNALRRNCGNIARASRELGVSRPTLHDYLRKFSITAAEFKDGVGPVTHKEGMR